MHAILVLASPFFALVACGWVAARLSWLPLSALPGLNTYSLFFALPALLFKLGATGSLLAGLQLAPLLVYATAGLLVVAGLWWFERRLQQRPRLDTAFAALTAAFPNSGFLGLPLLMGLLGPQAGGPVALTLLVDVFLISSLCLALSQQADTAHPLHRRLAWGLRGALRNPLPWAIAAGVMAGAFDLAPTGALARVVDLLGQAATPVALFALGATLERARRNSLDRHAPQPGSVATLMLTKLLLHPALVWAAAELVIRIRPEHAQSSLSPAVIMALVLTAALPCASNVSLLAERFAADTSRVARTIVLSTVAALISFTLWATLLGAGT